MAEGNPGTAVAVVARSQNDADVDDYERHQRVLNKRHERITGHLDCFIRIKVVVDRPDLSFYVVADRRNTIEYLMRQIEAEYTYKYVFPINDLSDLLLPPAQSVIPLECGELCNNESIPLKYEDKLGVSLDSSPVVHIVNVFEAGVEAENEEARDSVAEPPIRASIVAKAVPPVPENEVDSPIVHESSDASTPINYDRRKSNATTADRRKSNATVDRRKSMISIFNIPVPLPIEPVPQLDDITIFDMVRNKKGLECLYKFCLTDFTIETLLFWLDVQIFRSCPDTFRSQFGGYIYNMYLVADAPVKVNVSLDLMYDINAAIVSQVGVDVNMFDDAQQHVYSLLKMKTFARFKKTKAFEAFMTMKEKDEEAYKSNALPVGKLYEALHFTKLPLFHDDSPPGKNQIQLQTQEEKDIMRDLVLERVLQRYFPDCKFFDQGHGYYADPDRSQLIHRTQKKKMEKKLSKFFGDRPGVDELGRQKLMIDRLKKAVVNTQVEEISQLVSLGESIGGGSVRSSVAKRRKANPNQVGDNSSSALLPDEGQLKKKKFEKLVDFFGEPIPRDERKFFNNDSMLQFEGDVGGAGTSDDDDSDEVVDTINDLTPDEKRTLTKKARKLMTVFGDQGPEQAHILRQSIAKRTSIHTKSVLQEKSGEIVEEEGEGEDATDSIIRAIRTSVISEDGETESVVHQVQLTEEEFREIKQLRKKRLSKLTAFLGEEVGTFEAILPSIGSPETPKHIMTKEEKVVQRKRLQKLERVMGELVTTDILENALDVSDETPILSTGRRYSSVPASRASPTKKHQPVTVVIGLNADYAKGKEIAATRSPPKSPPNELAEDENPLPQLPRKDASNKHHSNLVKLNAMLLESNIEKALDLMDEMLLFDIDEFNMIKNKDVRKKKLKKLRKFFGDNLNPVQLFEQNVIAELEMTIKDEVKDPEQLKLLNDELIKVRSQVAIRGSDLQRGWEARKARKAL
ncbi:UNVERIFIED_CONTAM: hypothetical protein HDU68_006948 [Siphonaria sp. JEL0065]|nr:hypothetical protein HDU68_006948 [Siphonaria sp. JEL0065]